MTAAGNVGDPEHFTVLCCQIILFYGLDPFLLVLLNPGGYSAFSIGLNAFIADISRPDQRAFRMGMIHLAQSLGRPLAAPLGAYLLKTGTRPKVNGSALCT